MSFFKLQNPLCSPRNKSVPLLSVFLRTLTSTSSQNQTNNNKPLAVLFEEAVGLREKSEIESEINSNDELKSGLKELEREVRDLRANSRNDERLSLNVNKKEETKEVKGLRGIYSLFANNKKGRVGEKKQVRREEENGVLKELSPAMEMFVTHLYKEGYFDKANFLPANKKKLDFSCFDDSYGRDFIKFAAEKFGKDYQEIAKWLSGSELRKVALFGCPSTARKNVFSAKQLRSFFEIQEDTVCRKCVLKESCRFVNQSVWKGQHKNLNLAVVMRVITLYALASVPPELAVPDEIKASVSRLLKDVINLSQTTHKATSTACL